MKTFRVLCYKPKIDGHIVDNLISTWTKLWNLKAPKELTCSHVEIWLPDIGCDGTPLFVDLAYLSSATGQCGIDICGDCYSSTMGQVGGKNRVGSGVRKLPANEALKHPKRWFYFEFEVSDEAYEDMVLAMEYDVANNKGYDTKMIWSFFGFRKAGEKDKYICSEFSFKHLLNVFKIASWEILDGIGDDYTGLQCMQHNKIRCYLKTTMSPLLGAFTLHKCGITAFNLDGSVLLKGKS